jgi:ATP-binding cassette subfamily B protein
VSNEASLLQRTPVKIPIGAYWRLLRRYLAPQQGAAALMAALLLVSAALRLAAPQVVRAFIDAALAGARQEILVRTAIVFFLVTLTKEGLDLLATYWGERVAWTATNALRIDVAAHLVRLDLTFHKAHTPGELIERVDGDVNALAAFFTSFVVDLVGSVLLLIGILVVVSVSDVRLGVLFLVFSTLSLALLGWVHRFAPPHWQADRQCSADFFGFLGEVLTATEDIRACGAVEYAVRRFLEHLQAWRPVIVRAHLWGSIWLASLAALAVGDALARGIGGPLVRAGTLSLGTLYMIVSYVELVTWGPISTIRSRLEELQHAQASILRVRALLNTRSNIEDGELSLPPGALSVAFRSVSFAYPDATPVERAKEGVREAALQNLSFRLEAGRVLGLLGRTGSGKTTIARLLFRFYDPQEGEIRLGDVNLRRAKLASLRARIGLVTQEVQLFQASLRDNLTFYDPQISDQDLTAMLEALDLDRWLSRLPRGLDSPISGEDLSAGEAQLVALVRVFLKDPDLVILDEASSRLDPATEALMGQALGRLLDGRTAVIIAHRLATVARADDILILEDGRALEHGPRDQLAADTQSQFARLMRTGLEEVLT